MKVEEATQSDIEELIALESALFREDAGVHDPYSDPTWPEREGREDFESMIASAESLLLAARHDGIIVGLLAGYTAASSSAKQPVKYAVLRTLYVDAGARRLGGAAMLTEQFLTWARKNDCVEAHVDHYVANTNAGQFYEEIGFTARSISRVYPL